MTLKHTMSIMFLYLSSFLGLGLGFVLQFRLNGLLEKEDVYLFGGLGNFVKVNCLAVGTKGYFLGGFRSFMLYYMPLQRLNWASLSASLKDHLSNQL